jgi:hypothetical protein
MNNSGMLLLTLSDLTASLNARFAPEGALADRGPISASRRKQSQSGNRGMSEKCQEVTLLVLILDRIPEFFQLPS